MKINWKVRMKNKTFVVTFIAAVVAFVYQMAGIVGWVPPVTQDMVGQLIGAVLNVLVAVGILVDPTTKGAADSEQALMYQEPK